MTTPTETKPEVACPRCSARVRIHPTTNRIPQHRKRGESDETRCSFGGDYLPGFTPPAPIRTRRAA